MLNRVPDQCFIYCFILVPVNIPGGCDSRPVDLWMLVDASHREAGESLPR